MILHKDITAFTAAISTASENLKILPVFIEKDYWITLVLKRLADSKYKDNVVFKGGTSLSKGYKLIQRFSDDVDIAVIETDTFVGNRLRTLIRNVEKTITIDLKEDDKSDIASKGGRYRKSVFIYPKTGDSRLYQETSDHLIVEVNSFANPFPFVSQSINTMIYDNLINNDLSHLVMQYELEPFTLNILDKRRTLVEKTVSLIRFSYSEDTVTSLSKKIRHFYDIHFLYQDPICKAYCDFENLIIQDKLAFDDPIGWKDKNSMNHLFLKNLVFFGPSSKTPTSLN
ncbi:MAG: nucleotidyl transferase AbiEii/AbiGii toxin family protein [Bacteroidetes bacterium]|nr:nucleotidyl transferase AbiEii/AbiGii toxin family protein [Bacteroidota bacterium]